MAANTKTKKNEKALQKAREDQVYSRILCAFGVCFLLELLLIPAYRAFYTTDAYGLEYFLRGFWWLALLPAAACALWMLFARKGGKKLALPAWCLVFFLLAALLALLMGQLRHTGAKLGCVGLPVAAVLYCVYLIYQREFFMTALSFAGAILGLWAYRRALGSQMGLGIVASALVLIAVFALWTGLAARSGGRLWKNGPRFFRPQGDWILLFCAYGAAALALIGTLVFGAAFAYAATFALAGLVFVAAVYYTVKLL